MVAGITDFDPKFQTKEGRNVIIRQQLNNFAQWQDSIEKRIDSISKRCQQIETMTNPDFVEKLALIRQKAELNGLQIHYVSFKELQTLLKKINDIALDIINLDAEEVNTSDQLQEAIFKLNSIREKFDSYLVCGRLMYNQIIERKSIYEKQMAGIREQNKKNNLTEQETKNLNEYAIKAQTEIKVFEQIAGTAIEHFNRVAEIFKLSVIAQENYFSQFTAQSFPAVEETSLPHTISGRASV